MKTKVLIFVDRLRVGGIQTLLVNLVERIDRSKYAIDFLLLDDGEHYELEDKFSGMGSRIYKLEGVWIRKPTDYMAYNKKMNDFFRVHHDYHAIHMNSSSKNFLVLYYAAKYGIKVRIAHSHNIGFQTDSKVQIMVGNILKGPLRKYSTHFLSCSEKAGQWLFGDEVVNQKNFFVLKNGIPISNFTFSEAKRNEIRNKYNIEDKFVIGHTGRFTEQKNHEFLVDIFEEICKSNPEAVLLLVGTGEKEELIKQKVSNLGLNSNVVFVGYQDNVWDYMQAMDIFLFPSLFEGLGIVLIEAQAAGLPCYTSKDVVPREAQITPLLSFLPLEENAKYWAKQILNHSNTRGKYIDEIKEAGYDIEDVVIQLEKLYNLGNKEM